MSKINLFVSFSIFISMDCILCDFQYFRCIFNVDIQQDTSFFQVLKQRVNKLKKMKIGTDK